MVIAPSTPCKEGGYNTEVVHERPHHPTDIQAHGGRGSRFLDLTDSIKAPRASCQAPMVQHVIETKISKKFFIFSKNFWTEYILQFLFLFSFCVTHANERHCLTGPAKYINYYCCSLYRVVCDIFLRSHPFGYAPRPLHGLKRNKTITNIDLLYIKVLNK